MSLGKQRIKSLSDNGRVHATIAFTPGDGPVALQGYSRAPVSASAIGSTVSQATYNNTTHRFSLRSPPPTRHPHPHPLPTHGRSLLPARRTGEERSEAPCFHRDRRLPMVGAALSGRARLLATFSLKRISGPS